VTPSEFKALFPEFVAETSERVQAIIDLSAPWFDVDRWGGWYSEGVGNWVAHSISVANARAARSTSTIDKGATTEKHVGPVGTSFNGEIIMRQAEDTFMLTDYGRRYCELRAMVGLGGVAAASDMLAASSAAFVNWVGIP
jgi:hypothetical protein